MASRTPYFGFNFFGPDVPGSITDDSGKFTLADRLVLDRILKAFEIHDHSGGDATPDPSGPPPLALDTESGQLPGGLNIYYRVSYIDQYGLESAASFEGVVSTPTPLVPPGIPFLTAQAAPATPTGPGLGVGTYTYAVTALIGGQETPLGDETSLDLAGDLPNVLVTFPDPQDTQDQWSIWRQGPNDVGFTRIGTVDVTDTDFVDDGSVPSNPCADDPNQSPPTANLTAATNLVTIAVPDPDVVGATDSLVKSWRIYRSFTSGVYASSSLLADVTTTTDETSGVLQTVFFDDGTLPLQPGQPFDTSQVLLPSVRIGGGGGGGGGGSGGYVQNPILTSPDGTTYVINLSSTGGVQTDVAPPAPLMGTLYNRADGPVLIAPNDSTWRLLVDDDGSLVTVAVEARPGDALFPYNDGPQLWETPLSRWSLNVDSDGTLMLLPVIPPDIGDPVLTAVDGSHWRVVPDDAGDLTVEPVT